MTTNTNDDTEAATGSGGQSQGDPPQEEDEPPEITFTADEALSEALALARTERDKLQKKIARMREESSTAQSVQYVLGIAAFIGLVAVIAYPLFISDFSKYERGEFIFWLLIPFVLFGIFLAVRSRNVDSAQQIRDLEFELEIVRWPISPREIRAEQLFRRNEYDLSRYYHLNLRQNRWVLYIGVGCIVAGLSVVAATLAIVFGFFDKSGAQPTAEAANFEIWVKGIVGAVGAVGAIMVNFVAAIFLQMHSRVTEALGQFHKRLVGTNQLFLSNVLVSRIEDSTLREQLLGDLAKELAKSKTT